MGPETVDPLAAGGAAAVQGASMGAQFGPWGAVIGGAAGFVGGGLIAQEVTNPAIEAEYKQEQLTAYDPANVNAPRPASPLNTQAAPGTQPEETNPSTGEEVKPSEGVNVNNKRLTPGASSGGTLSTDIDPSVAQFWGSEPV